MSANHILDKGLTSKIHGLIQLNSKTQRTIRLKTTRDLSGHLSVEDICRRPTGTEKMLDGAAHREPPIGAQWGSASRAAGLGGEGESWAGAAEGGPRPLAGM